MPWYGVTRPQWINTLRPRQNGRHFTDDTFKCIFFNENVEIFIKISQKLVHKGPINNIPALVQIMTWGRPGDKPLSEPMVVRLPTPICVTRPQWVKTISKYCLVTSSSHYHQGAFKKCECALQCWSSLISMLYKNHILQIMVHIFCMEFQRYPLKL